MDYPVQDAHAHAWQLYDTLKLAGIQPTRGGYTIDPHWPFPDFTSTSATIGVRYAADRVSGHHRPLGAGTVSMSVRLPAGRTSRWAVVAGSPGSRPGLQRLRRGQLALGGQKTGSR
jgi:hypothetical protein